PGDMGALHVRLADEAFPLSSTNSYRNPDEMVAVAKHTGVDAVHPGYGQISEHVGFARACEEAGIVVVGPGSAVLEQVLDKVGTIEKVRAAGIPTTRPSTRSFGPEESEALIAEAAVIGYPLLVKACSGGRGRGTQLVSEPAQLLDTVRRSSSSAQVVYGDNRVYLESAILPSRYVEVSVLGDQQGNYIHLGDRDGSIQRNTRKVVEEAPAPGLSQELREAIWQTALRVVRMFGVRGVSTVEFVLDRDGNFLFTEVKPRVQVEHMATEMLTRIDVVREQLYIAAGLPLSYTQDQVRLSGHAMFCRVNAEDPWHDYLPSPGHITGFRIPGGPNVRVDTYVYAGAEVPVRYDSLLSKLVVWGATREECLNRFHRALQEFQVNGVKTNLGLLRLMVSDAEFIEGTYTTEFSRRHMLDAPPPAENLRDLAAVVALAFLGRAQAARPATPVAFTSGWHRDSRRLPQ
ncbi:MAG: ATP-grasp domain-containing protein, partial [Chloroflexales bacterium]|nr:ATP-grasp domain-containing protein [Chloroflexales bacterium]